MIRQPPRSTLFPYTTLSDLSSATASTVLRTRGRGCCAVRPKRDRKSTRLNSSHTVNSYAVFCLKKKKRGTTGSDDELTDALGGPSAGRRLRRPPLIVVRVRIEDHVGPRSLEQCFFLNHPATTEIYTLSLHDALPISTTAFASSRCPNVTARVSRSRASTSGWV